MYNTEIGKLHYHLLSRISGIITNYIRIKGEFVKFKQIIFRANLCKRGHIFFKALAIIIQNQK